VIPTEPPAATKAKAVEEDVWRRKPNAGVCGVLGSRCEAAGTGVKLASQSSANGALDSLEEVVKPVKLVDMLPIPFKILALRSQLNGKVILL
jgi:hypothetical protein